MDWAVAASAVVGIAAIISSVIIARYSMNRQYDISFQGRVWEKQAEAYMALISILRGRRAEVVILYELDLDREEPDDFIPRRKVRSLDPEYDLELSLTVYESAKVCALRAASSYAYNSTFVN